MEKKKGRKRRVFFIFSLFFFVFSVFKLLIIYVPTVNASYPENNTSSTLTDSTFEAGEPL